LDITFSVSMSPPELGGLDKTSQHGRRFGQASENPSAQRAQAPLKIRALDGVGAERDRALVRARRRKARGRRGATLLEPGALGSHEWARAPRTGGHANN
jgi:hypothetical protein